MANGDYIIYTDERGITRKVKRIPSKPEYPIETISRTTVGQTYKAAKPQPDKWKPRRKKKKEPKRVFGVLKKKKQGRPLSKKRSIGLL